MDAAAKRDRRIVFERGTVVSDDHGGETFEWQQYAVAFAEVRYGTGAERRDAAQERSSVAATFRVLSNPKTRGLTARDRIVFEGLWDVVSTVPFGRKFIDVTAIRSDEGE